ncbi:MAG: hypothetical protein M0R48_01695 [Candidatus Omnitrophica bacterium]|jgi:hypothetical protein|nr:hypothetical protein [Candidatus Omnitrophota bacterium]
MARYLGFREVFPCLSTRLSACWATGRQARKILNTLEPNDVHVEDSGLVPDGTTPLTIFSTDYIRGIQEKGLIYYQAKS